MSIKISDCQVTIASLHPNGKGPISISIKRGDHYFNISVDLWSMAIHKEGISDFWPFARANPKDEPQAKMLKKFIKIFQE